MMTATIAPSSENLYFFGHMQAGVLPFAIALKILFSSLYAGTLTLCLVSNS